MTERRCLLAEAVGGGGRRADDNFPPSSFGLWRASKFFFGGKFFFNFFLSVNFYNSKMNMRILRFQYKHLTLYIPPSF